MKKKMELTNPAARISSSIVRYLNIENIISSGNRNINAFCSTYSSRISFFRFIRVFKDIGKNLSKYSGKFILYKYRHCSIEMK